MAVLLAWGGIIYLVTRKRLRRLRLESLRADPATAVFAHNGCVFVGLAAIAGLAGVCALPLMATNRDELDLALRHAPIRHLNAAHKGKLVFLEGAVGAQEPVAKWGYVAFYRRSDSPNSASETHEPPFKLALPEQQAQVEDPANPAGADYRIENGAQHPEDSRLSGLRPNDSALVIGVVRSGEGALYIDADTIFHGDYAGYLAAQRGIVEGYHRFSNAAYASGAILVMLYVIVTIRIAIRRRNGAAPGAP
ncbi:MAG TPA: hypothetical protein VGE07_07335 [Herpetosiphonaceae bacterium]